MRKIATKEEFAVAFRSIIRSEVMSHWRGGLPEAYDKAGEALGIRSGRVKRVWNGEVTTVSAVEWMNAVDGRLAALRQRQIEADKEIAELKELSRSWAHLKKEVNHELD